MSGPILLIVNADDFGLARGVNAGVAEAFDRGILRSASLLAGGEFAEEAASIARERPGLGAGVHLALTQVKPILTRREIPTLIDEHGEFPKSAAAFIWRMLAGSVETVQIEAEFAAQIGRALALGVEIDHLDGHQHLHMLPKVRRAFMDVARKFNIRRMRLPHSGGPSISSGERMKALAIESAGRLARGAFRGMTAPEHFHGLACSGDLSRERLLEILRSLGSGTHELMTHPAAGDPDLPKKFDWGYLWETELAALCDPEVLEAIRARGIRLGNFKDLESHQGA